MNCNPEVWGLILVDYEKEKSVILSLKHVCSFSNKKLSKYKELKTRKENLITKGFFEVFLLSPQQQEQLFTGITHNSDSEKFRQTHWKTLTMMSILQNFSEQFFKEHLQATVRD